LISVLTRSNLHRYLQGHDIVICLIDTAQISLDKDNWYLFVAVDRIKHCVYVKLHDNKNIETSVKFPKHAPRSSANKSWPATARFRRQPAIRSKNSRTRCASI